jgi:hypothetical protein
MTFTERVDWLRDGIIICIAAPVALLLECTRCLRGEHDYETVAHASWSDGTVQCYEREMEFIGSSRTEKCRRCGHTTKSESGRYYGAAMRRLIPDKTEYISDYE